MSGISAVQQAVGEESEDEQLDRLILISWRASRWLGPGPRRLRRRVAARRDREGTDVRWHVPAAARVVPRVPCVPLCW